MKEKEEDGRLDNRKFIKPQTSQTPFSILNTSKIAEIVTLREGLKVFYNAREIVEMNRRLEEAKYQKK